MISQQVNKQKIERLEDDVQILQNVVIEQARQLATLDRDRRDLWQILGELRR